MGQPRAQLGAIKGRAPIIGPDSRPPGEGDRSDRGDRRDRGERSDRGDRPERGERRERNDRDDSTKKRRGFFS